MIARDIMTTEVIHVLPEKTAREVAQILINTSHGALPVVTADGVVVGVVSHQDLIRLALPEYLDGIDLSFLPADAGFFPVGSGDDCLGDTPVSAFMRRDYLPEVPATEPVAEIARTMLKGHIRRVVVTDEGRLVGIISRGDVVKAIVKPAIDGETETDV